jgi:AraC family transcriptional regulator
LDHYATDISDVPPSLYFENDTLKATLQKLQNVADGSGINDRAYAETLGLLLLWELRHAADPKYSQMNPVRGGLTLLQLRRIKEFVDARISKAVGISELASLVGLSQFHFIRAFKHSVGLSPYQYVLGERISVVKEMLFCRMLTSKLKITARFSARRQFQCATGAFCFMESLVKPNPKTFRFTRIPIFVINHPVSHPSGGALRIVT